MAENASTDVGRINSPTKEIQRSSPITQHNLTTMADNQPNAALLEQIEAMINRAITARIATPQPANQLPDQTKDADKANRQWYASDLGFFDPNYEGKSITAGEAMEHARKDTIFRDVYLFVECAKDVAAI